MTQSDTEPSERFRVRSLWLVLVLFLVLFSGGWWWQSRSIVMQVRRAGGTFETIGARHSLLSRFEQLLSGGWPDEPLHMVTFSPSSRVDDEWFREHCGGMSSIPRLYLDLRETGARVTDEGLGHLHGLENVGGLIIGGSSFTNAGMEHVASLPNLWYLGIRDTSITEEGLRRLSDAEKITHLILEGESITDAALDPIVTLSSLSYLELLDTAVTGEGLATLSALPSLTHLTIDALQVTDQSVPSLAECPSLGFLGIMNATDQTIERVVPLFQNATPPFHLRLDGSAVTDASVPVLSSMNGLHSLILTESGVSEEGEAMLRLAFPRCAIYVSR